MNIVASRVIKSPEHALALPKGALVSFRVGREISRPAPLTKVTAEGKTIVTRRGRTFHFRENEGKFILDNKNEGEAVVLSKTAAQRLARRLYMRKYMKGYLANLSPTQKKARRKYMKSYMTKYNAAKRKEAKSKAA